jgi:DNA invertase Pin-like site-specific DNA recombinase
MDKAIGYYRTSSSTNVGDDKDSQHRQRRAVRSYAKANKVRLQAEFYDAGVSGDLPLVERGSWAGMLETMENEGVSLIIVESADRLARSLVVQELTVMLLKEKGIRLLTSTGQNLTDNDDPSTVAMRQMAGVFSEYEKQRLVLKLRAARERIRAEGRRCEGQIGYAHTDHDLVDLAKGLRRKKKNRSYRNIAAQLFELGYQTKNGKPFGADQVKKLCSYTPMEISA